MFSLHVKGFGVNFFIANFGPSNFMAYMSGIPFVLKRSLRFIVCL